MSRCHQKKCKDMSISCNYYKRDSENCPCKKYTYPLSIEHADNNYKDMLQICTGRYNSLIPKCLCWQKKRLELYHIYDEYPNKIQMSYDERKLLWDKLELLIINR